MRGVVCYGVKASILLDEEKKGGTESTHNEVAKRDPGLGRAGGDEGVREKAGQTAERHAGSSRRAKKGTGRSRGAEEGAGDITPHIRGGTGP